MSTGGLSKFGVALVIIFAISILVILAQLLYVLRRRHVFRRRSISVGGGGDSLFRHSSSESAFSSIALPSKELLYFFCIRPNFLLDRSSLTADSGTNETNSNLQQDVEIIDIDLLKIQGVLGPPRFLFTIKEEEREGLESPAKTTPCPAENEMENIDDDEKAGSISSEDYLQSAEEASAVGVEMEIEDDDESEATSFSTPCASPAYFTPSASPVHEVVNGRSTGIP